MGCVLQAGVGQAPARQAAIFAGIPDSVPAVTVNKVCGSGLKAVIAGAQAIALGDAEVVVAGGMESMSNAPYVSHAMRGGARMGNVEFKDAMILDGLWDPVRQRPHGQLRRGVRRQPGHQPRQPGRVRARVHPAAPSRPRRPACSSAEIVPVTVPGEQGRATWW